MKRKNITEIVKEEHGRRETYNFKTNEHFNPLAMRKILLSLFTKKTKKSQ